MHRKNENHWCGQDGRGRDHETKYDFSYAAWFGSGVGMNREVPATHFIMVAFRWLVAFLIGGKSFREITKIFGIEMLADSDKQISSRTQLFTLFLSPWWHADFRENNIMKFTL